MQQKRYSVASIRRLPSAPPALLRCPGASRGFNVAKSVVSFLGMVEPEGVPNHMFSEHEIRRIFAPLDKQLADHAAEGFRNPRVLLCIGGVVETLITIVYQA
jgi:hypothetical protein